MKSVKKVKVLLVMIALTAAVFSAACGGRVPTCQFCGFNSNEQVQDLGIGGGLYGANEEGCITIIDTGDGSCSRFNLQPLSGTQS
jgi:hypothetical protein